MTNCGHPFTKKIQHTHKEYINILTYEICFIYSNYKYNDLMKERILSYLGHLQCNFFKDANCYTNPVYSLLFFWCHLNIPTLHPWRAPGPGWPALCHSTHAPSTAPSLGLIQHLHKPLLVLCDHLSTHVYFVLSLFIQLALLYISIDRHQLHKESNQNDTKTQEY